MMRKCDRVEAHLWRKRSVQRKYVEFVNPPTNNG